MGETWHFRFALLFFGMALSGWHGGESQNWVGGLLEGFAFCLIVVAGNKE